MVHFGLGLFFSEVAKIVGTDLLKSRPKPSDSLLLGLRVLQGGENIFFRNNNLHYFTSIGINEHFKGIIPKNRPKPLNSRLLGVEGTPGGENFYF